MQTLDTYNNIMVFPLVCIELYILSTVVSKMLKLKNELYRNNSLLIESHRKLQLNCF